MHDLEFSKHYSRAWDQFRESWPRILVCTILWLLVLILPIQSYVSRKQIFYFDIDVGLMMGGTISFYAIGVVICVVITALMLYSLFGVVHKTEEDSGCNILLCGIQGFVHPVNSFVVASVFQLISFIWCIGAVLLLNVTESLGYNGILSAILTFVWVLLILGVVLAWYKQMDEPGLSGMEAIKASLQLMKGQRTKTFVLLLPVVFCTWLFSYGAFSCYERYSASDSIEIAFAEQTLKNIRLNEANEQEFTDKLKRSAINKHDKKGNSFILSHEIFQKEKPRYEGNFEQYVHAMAEYGYQRELFEARREHRDISPLANDYFNRPPKIKSWVVGMYASGAVAAVFLAFALILLLHIYRDFDYVAEKFERKQPEKKQKQHSERARNVDASQSESDEPKFIQSNVVTENVLDSRDSKLTDMPDDLSAALKFMSGKEEPDPEPEAVSETNPDSESETKSETIGVPILSKPKSVWDQKLFSGDVQNNSSAVEPVVEEDEKPDVEVRVAKSAMSEQGLAERKEALNSWRNKLAANSKKQISVANKVRQLVSQPDNQHYPTVCIEDEMQHFPQLRAVTPEESDENEYVNRNPVDYSERMMAQYESEPQLHPISFEESEYLEAQANAMPSHPKSRSRIDNDYHRKKTVCFGERMDDY